MSMWPTTPSRESGTMLRVTLALCSALLTTPAYVNADNGAEMEVVPGEYVVSVQNLAPLRAKAVEALERVTSDDLEIVEANRGAVLIVPEGEAKRSTDEAVLLEAEDNLCVRLRKTLRLSRLAALSEGSPPSVTDLRDFSCSPNVVFHSQQVVPNDPQFNTQWGLHSSNDIDIDAPEAWRISRGSSNVVVGIIDSGVDYNHPDLVANMWSNSREVANGIDDDANGYIDDINGLNAITYNGSSRQAGNPMDDHGHGTHVAGTIGAMSDNGQGVTGVAWSVKMVPIKFLSASGSGSLMDAIEAVNYATDLKRSGVNLVLTNNSWGGGPYVQALYDAIQRAGQNGLVFVAAAGNSSQNTDVTPAYPASYALSNVVSVGALASNGDLASFSNYGATTVDIAAPGVQIASTYPGNRYVYMSGTSMAAPHVSGALALLYSYSWSTDPVAQINALYSRAQVRSNLASRIVGGRTLNIDTLLAQAPNNPAPPAATPTPAPPPPTPTPIPTPTPTATVAPGNFDLIGTVLFSGAPVEGARVALELGGTTLVRQSNSNGTFRFDDVPGPVGYRLVTTKSGLNFPALTGMLLRDTSLSVTATSKNYVLKVHVISPSKTPVRGVMIDAGPYGRSLTDSNGVAIFSVVHGALYSLTASSASHEFDSGLMGGELLGDTTRVLVARQKVP